MLILFKKYKIKHILICLQFFSCLPTKCNDLPIYFTFYAFSLYPHLHWGLLVQRQYSAHLIKNSYNFFLCFLYGIQQFLLFLILLSFVRNVFLMSVTHINLAHFNSEQIVLKVKFFKCCSLLTQVCDWVLLVCILRLVKLAY